MRRRQSVIRRFRLIECGSVNDLAVSGRLLDLHALPRNTELPRPGQQGKPSTLDSQGRPVVVWSISKTGIDPNSTQFLAKEDECQRLGGLGEPREVSS